MDAKDSLNATKRIVTGLAFAVFPIVFVFAFAVHPGLLNPHVLSPSELIQRARGADVLQFGHALVTLDTALLVVVALHFMKLLDHTSRAWSGFLGGALAVLGSLALAADKGALCLTMSALDTLPEREFAQMMPGLLAIFSFKGWMALVWGLVLLPAGVIVQTAGMLRARVLPRWQLGLLGASLLFIGFPDSAEIVNLTAALLMTAGMVPYGVRLLRRDRLTSCG